MDRNYEAYYNRMENGMREKIDYILDYLPSDYSGKILDFGCANGKFIEILRHFLPEANFIGVDNRKEVIKMLISENNYDNVRYYESIEDVPRVYKSNRYSDVLNEAKRFDVIIFSSVLHEVFSFENLPMKIIEAAKEADVIFIRDMYFEDSKFDFPLSRVRERRYEEMVELRDMKNSNKVYTEYLLKARYEDNWEQELEEDYFSVLFEFIEDYLIHSNFRCSYKCNYMNEFLRRDIEHYDGTDIADYSNTTHTKRIYVKR